MDSVLQRLRLRRELMRGEGGDNYRYENIMGNGDVMDDVLYKGWWEEGEE